MPRLPRIAPPLAARVAAHLVDALLPQAPTAAASRAAAHVRLTSRIPHRQRDIRPIIRPTFTSPCSTTTRRPFSSIPSRRQQQQQHQRHHRDGRDHHYPAYPPHPIHDAKPLLTGSGIVRALRSPSTKVIVVLAVGGAAIFYFSNLETVPVSGRTRFNCYSDESVRKTGDASYNMLMYEMERQGARFLSDWDPR